MGRAQREPRALVLRNHQSPGDVMMLTAMVRDLHLAFPGRFVTDVSTAVEELWENNPYVTPLEGPDRGEEIDCHYPLIHSSNTNGRHFVTAFHEDVGRKLGVTIPVSRRGGDVHLSPSEVIGAGLARFGLAPGEEFWLIVAGGKYDFTAKWWPISHHQRVVDDLRGSVTFVQIGSLEHHHPPLEGVIDLRGRTSIRDLVELVHWSTGVVCPVTFLMHLAAAVPGNPTTGLDTRPCVVLAGGREPVTWEAYPGHDFMHTIGRLECCASGGCWRSRVAPAYDGEPHDRSLCVMPDRGYARCMWMIEPTTVVELVRQYSSQGARRAE